MKYFKLHTSQLIYNSYINLSQLNFPISDMNCKIFNDIHVTKTIQRTQISNQQNIIPNSPISNIN